MLENWGGLEGDSGKSLNYYDSSSKKWLQTWVSDGGTISLFSGEFQDGAMRMNGETHFPNGKVIRRRLTFTPSDAGVRQYSGMSRDGGKTWQLAYDYFYSKKPVMARAGGGTGKHPCAAVEFRQFDFWVGDWNVTMNAKAAGVNRVEKLLDGCLIMENWTGAKGGIGKSFNYDDAVTRGWHQVWVDGAGGSLNLSGEWRAGALRYEGQTRLPDGRQQLERLTFTPMPDGTVRQFWEQSVDVGKTWSVAFDGVNARKGSPQRE